MARHDITINALLKRLGIDTRLYAGKGYAYWSGVDVRTQSWPSVYVCRISELSMKEWLDIVAANCRDSGIDYKL